MLLQWIATLVALVANSLIGLVVISKNSKNATNVFFAFFSFFLASYILVNQISLIPTESDTQLFWMRLVMLIGSMLNLLFFLFVFHFPNSLFQLKQSRKLQALCLLTVIVATMAMTPLLFSGIDKENSQPIPNVGMGLFLFQTAFLLVGGFVLLIKKYIRSVGVIRSQVRLVLTGAIIMFVCIVITNIIFVFLFNNSSLVGLLPLYTIIFTSLTAIAIIKHRFLDSSFIVMRAISYSILIICITVIYTSLLFGIKQVIPQEWHNATAIFLTLIVAFSFGPLKRLIEKYTHRYLFVKAYSPEEVLERLSIILRSTILLKDLAANTLEEITNTLQTSFTAIIIYHESEPQIFSYQLLNKQSFNEHLLRELSSFDYNAPLITEQSKSEKLRQTLREHHISVVVALSAPGKKLGLLLIGDKSSGGNLPKHDIHLIELIAYQLSIAINNALAYEEIKAFNVTLKEEVERATAKLKAANARLKELDTLKDEFVSIASHELRTPLTSIRNYQWMLLNGKGGELAEKQRYYLDRAYRATNRLTKLVTDMLNVSRIDSGRVLLAPEKCDLFEMTNEIIEELAVKSNERQIVVEHQRPKKKLPEVVIDRDKIYEVITNLLSNAIKYTQIGGAITISYVHGKEMITFVIEDNGMGIDPKYLNDLFTKFGFVKDSVRSNHPNTESTGLGLYISKAIVSLHGGKIWAKSAGRGKGSTFAFTIPVYSDQLYERMTKEYVKEKDAGLLHNSVD